MTTTGLKLLSSAGGLMQVGRNEPCPCGSGKKFKKCCLDKDRSEAFSGDLLWRQMGSIHDDMAKRLLEHGVRAFGRTAIEEAWEEFWSWENETSFAEAYETEPHEIQLFMPYFLYNWTPDPEDTQTPESAPQDIPIAADFLAKRGGYLTELERRFLSATIQSPFSFHDVVEVEAGKRLVLRDIFLGTEVDVTERMGSRHVQVGDIVFGKVIQMDHVGMLCGMSWVAIPPVQKQAILDLRKRIREAPCRKGASIDPGTLQDYDIELREVFLDIEHELSTPPKLCNTDGEEISFHQITYAIDSPALAFDKLKGLSLMESEEELLEDAERGTDGVLRKATITWHKRGNKVHASWDNTVMGRFLIDNDRLVIEVNSEKRAERARKEVEKRLKGHASHKSTVLQSPESMMRSRDEVRSPTEEARREEEQRELMSRPEVQGLLRQNFEAHWEQWYQEKIPALGGKTPLQAAKTPDGREMLEALLTDYERNDSKANLPYQPDYRQMRERLGLPVRSGGNLLRKAPS